MTKKPSDQVSWGIIRYAAGSGPTPETDAAAFDGWYRDRAQARMVAKDWVARHPHWIVGLVRSDPVWFGDGDFTSLSHAPITYREKLLTGKADIARGSL